MKRSRDDFDNDSLSSMSNLDSPDGSAESVKIVHLSQEVATPVEVMRCSLPGHTPLSFSTYDEYESHYNQSHLWRCTECRKNFPSEHYLGLHIEENHDSMMEIRKERGEKIYACFVEDCDRKCSAPHKRRMHLIDKHFFPPDYDFQIIRTGIDHRSSMLRSGSPQRTQNQHREGGNTSTSAADKKKSDDNDQTDALIQEKKAASRSGLEQPQKTEEDESFSINSNAQHDVPMNDLVGAMSSLKFIPPSIRFGRGGRGRGGLSRN